MAKETKTKTASDNQPTPSIDLQDLAMTLQLLNVAIKRGAFEPTELVTVGNVYSKVDQFLQSQVESQQQATQADTQPEDDSK